MIFDIDYINIVWQLLVPPDKRQPKQLEWGAALMEGKQWKHNALFTTYMGGDGVDLAYNPTASYTAGQRVIYYIQSYSATYTGGNAYYGDNGVYECLSACTGLTQAPKGSNVVPDVPPAWVVDSATALTWLTTGNAGSPFYWVKVTDNFIGANERASYSPQKLMFEYALNRWFDTTFRQPSVGTSDIFIGINSNTNTQFFFGQTATNFFFGPATNFTKGPIPLSTFFTPGNSFLLQYDYSIHLPIAVYNALINPLIEGTVAAGHNSPLRDGVVSAFANILNPAGSFYNIITY